MEIFGDIWSSMEKGHIMDKKTQNCFQNTQMSYKSGASYNSPGRIRCPSAHTQREADIWGESRYIYAVQIYKGRVQI